MAVLTLHADRLHNNFKILDKMFRDSGAEWSIVTKLLCGHKEFTAEVMSTGLNAYCDSRLSNMKMVKKIDPDTLRIYIKPPPKRRVKGVVENCHISFNSEISTVEWLSEAAQEAKVNHGVLVMVEGGDLREGVTSTRVLIQLCEAIAKLPNISLVGIGTNFNCLTGVLPTQDAIDRLLYQRDQVEQHLGQELKWVSAGSSVVIPALMDGDVPSGMNHWRIGETLYYGNNLINGEILTGMEPAVFTLEGEIIEIGTKPAAPHGPTQPPPFGTPPDISGGKNKLVSRAIVDVGLLDIGNTAGLKLMDERLKIVGGSSDMIVVDVTEADEEYAVGGTISFRPGYTHTLSLMNSKYVDKRVVNSLREDPSLRRAPLAARRG